MGGFTTFVVDPFGGTCAIVDWGSKKQLAAAFSTAESEIVALKDASLRSFLPITMMFEFFLEREMQGRMWADPDTARLAIQKRYSSALSYLRKHQQISLAALHHMYYIAPGRDLRRVDSATNTADAFTKHLKREIVSKHRRVMGFLAEGEWPQHKDLRALIYAVMLEIQNVA